MNLYRVSLDGELQSLTGGYWRDEAPRWDARPVTRFEERGTRAGRPVVDFTYVRR